MKTETILDLPVAEIVIKNPGAAEVFEKYKIDFCCSGKRSLAVACRNVCVDSSQIVEEIQKADGNLFGTYGVEDWSLNLLVNYILQSHHQYVKRAIPEIRSLANKVVAEHGALYTELIEIQSQFNFVARELETHMQKEESILFPAIIQMARQPRDENAILGFSLRYPIEVMEKEHQFAGDWLDQIRKLSSEFMVPNDACLSHRLLYTRLQEFEKNLHVHVHLENNILFPKALEMEADQI